MSISREIFDWIDVEELARERARPRQAGRPARRMGALPVVIRQGTGGVLFHEACGHGSEADHVAKEERACIAARSVSSWRRHSSHSSTTARCLGEWGTLGFDDEGHRTQRNVLIENGVLTDYMSSSPGRATTVVRRAATGKYESYMHLPMVRMTNTIVLDSPGEIVDHRWYRSMSELLDIADRVIAQAAPGQQVEAYITVTRRRSASTAATSSTSCSLGPFRRASASG